jgi:uncharacterized protein YbaR (Trm112 family)
MEVYVCPECDEELIFYADMNGDEESDFGGYYCENKECEDCGKEIYNDGDFE